MIKVLILLLTGTGAFRFYVQPIMALIKGVRAGRNDVKSNDYPLMLRLTRKSEAFSVIKVALKDIFPILFIGFLLDLYAQWELFHHINLGLSVLVIFSIVLLPYFASRDLTARLYRINRK